MGEAFFKLLAIALMPVCAAGCCLFAILAPPTFLDRSTACWMSAGGAIGTAVTGAVLVRLCRRGPAWEFLALGRDTLISIICIAWILGAIGGISIFYIIPG